MPALTGFLLQSGRQCGLMWRALNDRAPVFLRGHDCELVSELAMRSNVSERFNLCIALLFGQIPRAYNKIRQIPLTNKANSDSEERNFTDAILNFPIILQNTSSRPEEVTSLHSSSLNMTQRLSKSILMCIFS